MLGSCTAGREMSRGQVGVRSSSGSGWRRAKARDGTSQVMQVRTTVRRTGQGWEPARAREATRGTEGRDSAMLQSRTHCPSLAPVLDAAALCVHAPCHEDPRQLDARASILCCLTGHSILTLFHSSVQLVATCHHTPMTLLC